MPQTRKLVRDKLLAVLADQMNGFNARFAEPLNLDWGAGSMTLIQAFVAPEQLPVSDLIPADQGICVALYTSTSQTNSNEERQKPSIFSGKILVHVDFHLVRRPLRLPIQGRDLPNEAGNDLESLLDAIEDAFLLTIMSPSVDWSPVDFNGDFSCARDALELTGDGWQQRLPFTLLCEVHV